MPFACVLLFLIFQYRCWYWWYTLILAVQLHCPFRLSKDYPMRTHTQIYWIHTGHTQSGIWTGHSIIIIECGLTSQTYRNDFERFFDCIHKMYRKTYHTDHLFRVTPFLYWLAFHITQIKVHSHEWLNREGLLCNMTDTSMDHKIIKNTTKA